MGAGEIIMQLRDYQEDIAQRGLAILRQYMLVYLSMEVRTGKTITALSIADRYGAKRPLFVTKKKAIGSITSDEEEALGDYQKLNPSYELKVINYEQLHNVYPGEHDFFILDEAHCTGAFPKPSKRSLLLKEICKDCPIIYLSGSPSPESYSQLYHQFFISSFTPFKEWPSFYKWAAEFVTLKKKYFFNRQINDYSCADKAKIDSYTGHLFISFTQEQAGFKQMVKQEVLPVRMAEGTYLLAAYLKKHRVHVGKHGEEILADTAVKLMNKLHQIYSGSVKDEKGNSIGFDLTKARYIKERFNGQKIAIFYKFVAERLMLISVFGYDKITEDPTEFNKRTDLVFISQIQAGREGINLSTADALVGMNIDFSALSYIQMQARIQAKDREKECLLYWVFAEGGIEQKIYEKVINKQDYTLSYFQKDLMLVGEEDGQFYTKVNDKLTIWGATKEDAIKKAKMYKQLENYMEG